MQTASSARRTCIASASAVECTATVLMPISCAGAVDAQRDLAAIGDQEFLDGHGAAPYSITTSGWSNSTGWPFSTKIAFTVPPEGAVIGFITFIASTMTSVSPAFT
jgi:hypothetical protein